jgi:hypothetical protein
MKCPQRSAGEDFAAAEHVGYALVSDVATGEKFAGEEDFAGLPSG